MRLLLTIQRHGLPPARVLWTLASAVRPPLVAASNSITVSQFLEQVNEVIPIESEDWGLEDYSVEVRGFECLHFQELNQVLREDDEVCIRPLQTQDLRFRKVSGRHQIAADGKHLIDGVAFGRPFLRRADRPAIRIPPRKRRRITYDDEGDSDFEELENDQQIVVRAGFDNANDVTAGDESDSGEDFATDAEYEEQEGEDLGVELKDLRNDLIGTPEADDGIGQDGIQLQRITRSRRSPKGLGLLELLDDDGRPFTGQYNNPLLDFYGQVEASKSQPEIRVRKRGSTDLTHNSSEKLRSILRDPSASPQRVSRRDSAGSNRSVRFEDAELATPATIRESEDSEDADDGDFELCEMDESDKENAKPQNGEIDSTDNFFEGSQSSSSTSSDELFEDETSSSGTSSSSSSSDSEPEQRPSKNIVHGSERSETSSSGSSSSSSSDSEPQPSLTGQKRKRAIHDSKQKLSANEVRPTVKATASVSNATAPGNGSKQTRSRNKRRKASKKLSFIKSKGILPITATKSDLQKLEEETTESERSKMIAVDGVRAAFENKREALLASIIASGVDTVADPSPRKSDGITNRSHSQVGEQSLKAAGDEGALMADQPASEEGLRKIEPEETSGNILPTADTARIVEAMDSPAIDFQGLPDSTEASNSSAALAPESQHRRSKLDVSGAKRMLFGSLGLRTPKTKDDEAKIREKLMKDVRPVKEPHVNAKIETIEDVTAAAEDESWKDKIDLRAVECCHEGIRLSTPPFPFVQRWDPQQQRGYTMGNAKKRKGKKRKRRNNDNYEDNSLRAQVDVVNGNDDEYYDDHPSNRQNKEVCLNWDESYRHKPEPVSLTSKANTESHHPEHSHDEIFEDSVEVNAQLRHAAEDDSPETLMKIEANDSTNDLPILPEDISVFPSLTLDKAAQGNIVAFKQLEMSAETNWQPKISGYRTAIIDNISDDGALSMTLAKRDQPSKNIEYDEQTGQRVYSKFEMPGYQDEDEEDETGKVNISFDELINPLLVAAASVEDDEAAMQMGQGHTLGSNDSNEKVATEEVGYTNSLSKGFNLDDPVQEVSSRVAVTDEETRQEISKLIRDAGWRSSINHEVTDPQEEVQSGQSKETNKALAPFSPKFNGFSSSPVTNGFEVASSPPTAAVPSSTHHHASGSEIAESVSPQRPDDSPAGSHLSNGRFAIDYPNLPQINDDSGIFQQEAQDRSAFLEADHQIASQDLTRSSSIRRSLSQGKSSPVLTKFEESSSSSVNTSDIADSDDSLPELFSQAFEERMSQGRDIKQEISDEEYISPPNRRKSKRNGRIESPQRESDSDWEPRSSESDREDGGESTPRASQPGFSSQIVDLTISSDTVDPPDDSYVDDDGYVLPKGPGWVQKSRIKNPHESRTKKTTRGLIRSR